MKTEEELNELLDELRKGITPEDVIEHFGDSKKSEIYDKIIKIALLQWILSKPIHQKPKRTIFDLGEQELKELAVIVFGEDEVERFGYKITNTKKEICPNFVKYEMHYSHMYGKHNPAFEFRIYENLDFHFICDNCAMKVNNQIKLRNRLNEMLSEEKK